MRDNVISLKVCQLLFRWINLFISEVFLTYCTFQVVLANGDIVKTASRARKSAAGYVVLSPMSLNNRSLSLSSQIHAYISSTVICFF